MEALQGISDKVEAIRLWSDNHGIALGEIAFVGNDINDLGVLEIVGFPFIVSDAHSALDGISAYRIPRKGGQGAVRYLCDLLVESCGVDSKLW